MRYFGYFFKSINLLNISLAIAVIIMARHSFYPEAMMIKNKALPQDKNIVNEEAVKLEEYHGPSLSEFTIVAEQNLFHPERKIPPEKIASALIPTPEIILYGTLITEGERIAYVEDKKLPYTTPGRGKRQLALKTGNTICGFKLVNIEADKIELIRDEERMIVYLMDSGKPKARETPGQASAALPSTERGSKQNPATSVTQPAGAVVMKPPPQRR